MAKRFATLPFALINIMTFIASLQLLPNTRPEKGGILFMALTFAATLVHQTGHAIAVWVLGAKLQVIAVWDLGYNFATRRFGVQKFNGKREIAGYVRYNFRGEAKRANKELRIAAAGPGANFATALIATGLGAMESSSDIRGALTLFAILSVGFAAVNLVPFAGSDGQTIWNIIKRRY